VEVVVNEPDRIPTPAEAARLLASQHVVFELFSRLDERDLDGALALYADDAVFLGAQGRAAIRDVMVEGLAPNADKRSRHAIANVRGEVVGPDEAVVRYTAVTYTLDGGGPYPPRSVLDQQQRHRVVDGRVRIVRHEIFGLPDA
jgi:hypothetical protein